MVKFIIFGLLSPFIIVFITRSILIFKYIVIDKRKLIPKINKYKPTPFLKKFFIDFPIAWANDFIEYDPNNFEDIGLHLVCGEQGAGKTIFVTWFLNEMRAKYPELRIRSNYNYVHEHGSINSWKDIVFMNNGMRGQIDVIDEIQNWFSSLQSKDFPPEMLTEITQQRKQRKMILGTGQVFSRMAKPFREQAKFVYLPITLFRCVTFVRKYKPELDDQANIKKMRLVKVYFIVQTKQLRNSFDTYKKIADLSNGGFIERNWSQYEKPVNAT